MCKYTCMYRYDEKIRYAGKKNITQGLTQKVNREDVLKNILRLLPVPYSTFLCRPVQYVVPMHSPVVNKINNPMTTLIPLREAAFLEKEERLYDYDLQSLHADYNNTLNTPFERKKHRHGYTYTHSYTSLANAAGGRHENRLLIKFILILCCLMRLKDLILRVFNTDEMCF